MHPSERLLHILLRFKALHELNHLQIRYIDFRMLCQIVILLSKANTLCTTINRQ
ncbi:hypothetical protein Hanom_Chr09g00806701 [Helianthus anomalus]